MPTPQRLIAAARGRIRRRHALRGAVLGGWIGVGLGAVVLVVSRLWWPSADVPPWAVALAPAVIAPLIGLVAGWLRPVLGERELALLVDRALGTDEVLVTLMHLEEAGQAPPAVQADLERRVAALTSLGRGVQAGPPAYAWLVPVAALIAALVLLVPQREGAIATGDTDSTALADEADRLRDALDEIDEEHGEALPEELQAEIDSLVDDLDQDKLTPEEAAERIAELQEQLEAWEDSLEQGSGDDAEALQQAADALREPDAGEELDQAMEQLADALEDQDLDAASDAIDEAMEQLQGASGEQQQKMGEALQRAGEALQGAGDEGLQQAGEALESAGEQLAKEGQRAQGGDPGEGGESQPGDEGPSAQERLEQLKRQLQDDQALKERLKQDREKLKRSQEVNGALEASRQRLGGEAKVAQGEQGEGQSGQGQGQGQGAGEGEGEGEGPGGQPGTGLEGGLAVEGPPNTGAGEGHTWEDAGTFDTTAPHQDADRLSDRTAGQSIDDFESFYDPVRMEGADTLLTPVQGQVDERGHIDELPTVRTQGDEQARRKLLDIPDAYTDAADEALTNERVPPGYRAAVKDYFDSME